MRGTVANESSLQKQLAHMEEMNHTEREARKAEEKRFHEHEEMWDKQQTVHENLAREYRLLLGKHQAAEKKLETLQKSNVTLTERLTTRTSEMRELEKQLEEQRATHLLSSDQQIVEITNLRKALATAQQEKEKAIKDAAATNNTLEYTRTAYQDAQNAAATCNTRIAELEAQVAKLAHAASGEAAKLKTMHLDRSYDAQNKMIKSLKAELGIAMKALQNKDEEITRLKSMGRQGVGTRGTSVTPQPKIRSRAGSPSLIGGRLSNLRNG
jgi:chromosome segregation ATPase